MDFQAFGRLIQHLGNVVITRSVDQFTICAEQGNAGDALDLARVVQSVDSADRVFSGNQRKVGVYGSFVLDVLD